MSARSTGVSTVHPFNLEFQMDYSQYIRDMICNSIVFNSVYNEYTLLNVNTLKNQIENKRSIELKNWLEKTITTISNLDRKHVLIDDAINELDLVYPVKNCIYYLAV